MQYKIKSQFGRARALLIALVLIVAALVPVFEAGTAHAISYGLVTSRSIEMTDSTANATGVTYTVGFTTATAGIVQGVIVDFCSSSPILGDTCTLPSGFSVGTPTVTGVTGLQSGTWTAASMNSGRTLKITNTGSTSTGSGTAVTFNLTTATNPSATNTTFYARILTFDTTGDAGSYADTGANTGLIDAGGIALSTANNITITAKVQEAITFCVYTTGGPCGTGSTVALGDSHGVLSTTVPYVDKSTKFDIATNASSGAIIRLKGDTLKSGSNSIAAIGNTAVTSAPGTSQFGLCEYESSGTNLTITPLYNGNNGGSPGSLCSGTTTGASGDNSAKFAFDTNGTTGTTSTYGQQIASEVAGASSTGTIPFIGNVSATQQAGIYTTTLIFIATGTY